MSQAPPCVEPPQARAARPQTIALVVDQGFAARYLLRTELFTTLKASGAKLVVFTPNADEDYFSREFADAQVAVELLDHAGYAREARKPLHAFLRNLRWYASNRRLNLNLVDIRYEIYRGQRRADTLLHRAYNRVFDLLVWLLRRSATLRRLLVRAESALLVPRRHTRAFEAHRPEKVVITSLGFLGYDHYMMREARAHGAKVVSVILSWDNTSTKGLPGAEADHVVAWSEHMREELVDYAAVAPERIFVGGVAHFDSHHRREGLWDRETLFERHHLDPSRKLIFFALRSPNKFPWNPELVARVACAVAEGRLVQPCQLLVRVHPLYFRMRDGKPRYQEDLDRLLAVQERYPHLAFDVPRMLSSRLPMDMPAEEMIKLGSILAWSNVLLSYFSTVMLEAAIFDVPIVNVALYPHNEFLQGDVRRVAESPHIDSVLKTGGVRTAYTAEELIESIDVYLRDPRLDAEGRKRIRELHCGAHPGQAGRRIAEHILNL